MQQTKNIFFIGIIFFVFSTQVFAVASITLSPQRLKVPISQDSMNRIAVTNDRITHVFGDQEAYEIQTEETTGQVFLKPTVENGNKPLSITLMTENNITQDLTLEPVSGDARTLIFKSHDNRSLPHSLPQDLKPLRFQEHMLELMKTLILGGAVTLDDEEIFQERTRIGCVVTFKKAYKLGDMRGVVFNIKNTTETVLEIQAEEFFQTGDLAITVETPVLKPNGTSIMYVVMS
jgi:type-F conjugative transfer system secretin TraK